MMMVACAHTSFQKYGKTAKSEQRYRCNNCGHVWFDAAYRPLGDMRLPVADAKRAPICSLRDRRFGPPSG